MDLTKLFNGKKTYAAAVGLLALAVYQYSTGDLPGAIHTALTALTAFGLRSAIANQDDPTLTPTPTPTTQPQPISLPTIFPAPQNQAQQGAAS